MRDLTVILNPDTSPEPAFRTFCNATERVTRFILASLIGAIVLITIVSVWYRYVINDPVSWSEQVSRILFVWVTFLGTAVLYRHMLHISIDMLLVALPQRVQFVFFWINQTLILILAILLFWFGGKHSLENIGQTFGALEITPSSFYFAAPVSAALIILYWIEKVVDPSFRSPTGELHR